MNKILHFSDRTLPSFPNRIALRVAMVLGIVFLLASCTPRATVTGVLPPDAPIVFKTSYDSLFGATLEALTRGYDLGNNRRIDFTITQANLDTGLITVMREKSKTEKTHSTESVYLREYDRVVEVKVDVPVENVERTIITIVVNKMDTNHASLIYSGTTNGRADGLANAYMGQVVNRLIEKFTVTLPE